MTAVLVAVAIVTALLVAAAMTVLEAEVAVVLVWSKIRVSMKTS